MAQDTPARQYEQVDADRQQMLAQLNGMYRVLEMPISDEAKTTVQAQIARHRERLALMDAVVEAFHNLEAHGYPDMPVEPSETVQHELGEVLRANQEQVKSQMSQVADELSHVQDLFGGSRRRGRRAAAEEHKASESDGEAKA
jgi:hypothetical protein